MEDLVADLDVVLAFESLEPLVFNVMDMKKSAVVRFRLKFEHSVRAAVVIPRDSDSDVARRFNRAVTIGRDKDGLGASHIRLRAFSSFSRRRLVVFFDRACAIAEPRNSDATE